ncbi:MAG: polysaccharide biosynthesis/export family protein [Bacteroidales bacterium]
MLRYKKKIIILFSFVLIIMGFESCQVLRPSEMFQIGDDYPLAEFESSQKEYKIKPFDKLALRITTNEGFALVGLANDQRSGGSGNSNERQRGLEYLVEYDGLIKLPTLGRVKISGMTIREAETFLEEEYSEYYQEPFVLMEVTNRKVIIFKDGGTSGTVLTIPSENLTLIEALAQSGGITDISKAYRIKLIRGDLTGDPKVYYYDISALKELQDTNILLQANDVIYVESKPKYVNRVLTEISPYLTLLTTGLTVYGLFIAN